jgi:hypothetical protein
MYIEQVGEDRTELLYQPEQRTQKCGSTKHSSVWWAGCVTM